MKHLKLVINNRSIKRDIFFNKIELKLILNLYAEMVSGGEWKDYGLSITKKEASFNVYRRSSEFPIYKITKNLKPKNEGEKYLVRNSQNKIINYSENLQKLIKKIIWKKLNYRWISFFVFVAILNEIIWRTQSEAFWVNFKVWGLIPISFIFAASQFPLINKYKLKQ